MLIHIESYSLRKNIYFFFYLKGKGGFLNVEIYILSKYIFLVLTKNDFLFFRYFLSQCIFAPHSLSLVLFSSISPLVSRRCVAVRTRFGRIEEVRFRSCEARYIYRQCSPLADFINPLCSSRVYSNPSFESRTTTLTIDIN